MTASPIGRLVEIAEDGRYLSKTRGFLTVSAEGAEIGRVPLDDITAVIATSPTTTASCVLLTELAERGVPFVLCGRNRAPAAILWPVSGHHAQQRRMEAQIGASPTLTRRLWALLVAAKIRRQGCTLREAGQPHGAFVQLARAVKSGDPANIEAQAARRYWPLLMGAMFRRDPDGDGANGMLNYGYAVLRSAIARAIVASGLHPGIGVFHRHPHNPMPLADDLMEPFRPIVDLAASRLFAAGERDVTPSVKRSLAAILQQEQPTVAGRTPLSTCMVRLAASLAESFLSGHARLDLPRLALSAGEGEDEAGS